LTDLNAVVTDNYNYDAFGNLLSSPGPTPNNYLYRGEQYDSDLGLYYLRARYYNPQTGRFLSRDPEDGKITDPATLHKYLYANGDPINGVDPMGREAYFEAALEIAILNKETVHLSGAIDNCDAEGFQAIADLLISASNGNVNIDLSQIAGNNFAQCIYSALSELNTGGSNL